jgi:hypothetical protein
MNAIQAVPPQDQRSFRESVVHGGTGSIISRIVAAVANFFTAIGHFIYYCFQNREKRAIQVIPQQQREDVLAQTRSVIEAFQAYNRSGDFRAEHGIAASDRIKAKIIEAIAGIRVEERITLIPIIRKIVLQFAFENRKLEDLDNFIIEVINKNTPEKMQAVECVSSIFNIGFSYMFWIRTFDAIAMTPPNERNQLKDLALLFNYQQPGPDGTVLIIQALAEVPADEREDVVLHALQLITPQMYGTDVMYMIRNMAAVPADERAQYVRDRLAGIHQNHAPEQGVNVHEGDRDQRVNKAIELIRRQQGTIAPEKITQAIDQFINYLDALPMDAAQKKLAKDALLLPRGEEGFGPLLKGGGFTILGKPITGEELIGRLWIFASQLNEKEQTNAKRGMISALQNSYENGARVCNQGKTQRLIVAVLQGRLKEVDIDRVSMPKRIAKADAMQLFFTPERQKITIKAELLQAVAKFCDENPGIDKQEFLVDINAYAVEQEMA